MAPKQPDRAERTASQDEAVYTAHEIAAEAAAFDTQPWAVHGIFREAGKERMTATEFRAARDRWHAPAPEQPGGQEG